MQLWYASPDILCDEQLDARCRALLARDELDQAARFRQPWHQRQHVLTRYMVRQLLGQRAGVAPQQLAFAANAFGKPHVARPAGFRGAFNVSHSTGMVVCALAEEGELGVDIEPLDRDINVELADRYFAPCEAAALREQAAERQAVEFLRYWTLKEAFIKAHGTGLSTPLADFGFDLTATPQPVLRFTRGALPPPPEWSFAQFVLRERWLVAIAWRVGAQRAFSCEPREFQINAG